METEDHCMFTATAVRVWKLQLSCSNSTPSIQLHGQGMHSWLARRGMPKFRLWIVCFLSSMRCMGSRSKTGDCPKDVSVLPLLILQCWAQACSGVLFSTQPFMIVASVPAMWPVPQGSKPWHRSISVAIQFCRCCAGASVAHLRRHSGC